MRILFPLALLLASYSYSASQGDLPSLPYHAVENWAKLPPGWNFGECAGVAVDRHDNVWIFNRGPHPVIQFDSGGRMLKAWSEVPVKSAHGIRIDAEDNIWLVDVAGHKTLKMSPEGRVLMVLGAVGDAPGTPDSTNSFNRPTNVGFATDGSFFVTDGYVNSRVLHYSKDGEFIAKWGKKGTGDSEFDIVHDVVLDKQGRLYVADRENLRIQIFDQNGKLLGKWTDIGAAWGLSYLPREDAIYMADGRNDRIVKLSMDGKIIGAFGSHGKTAGKFDFPHGIAVDSTGAVYVAEIKNWRVQKLVK